MMKNLNDLLERLRKFKKDRDWEKYHNPKDVAISVVIEASELLEIFQWIEPSELPGVVEERMDRIKDEIADVFLYLLSLCDALNLDILKISFEKLEKNEKKYPVERFKGTRRKYNEFPLEDG